MIDFLKTIALSLSINLRTNSGQIAATFLTRNFKLLALVYPVKSIFKIDTFCFSGFKFTARQFLGNPRG